MVFLLEISLARGVSNSPLCHTLYSSRASFQELTSAESSHISECETVLFAGAIALLVLFLCAL
jgi:hypothetical protein